MFASTNEFVPQVRAALFFDFRYHPDQFGRLAKRIRRETEFEHEMDFDSHRGFGLGSLGN